MRRAAFLDSVLLIVATIGLAHLYYAVFASGMVGTVVGWTRGEIDPPGAKLDRATDQLMRDAMREPGNVVLTFEGDLAALDPDVLFRFYTRSTYMHWPKRIYVAQLEAIVLRGDDLKKARPPSDPSWLTDHHVRAMLRVRLDRASVQRVSISSAP